MTSMVKRAKQWARKAEALAARIGPAQSARDIERQSLAMWRDRETKNLAGHSHACDDAVGLDEELWRRVGRDAWDRFSAAAAALDWTGHPGTLLDYGCGHGAQASAFAPWVHTLIGVDIQADALAACDINVAKVTWERELAGPDPFEFIPTLIDEPEDVLAHVPQSHVDAFVSFYVFELLPGQEYGERVLRMAFDVLRPGGISFVQFKYPTGGRWDGSLRRRYNTRTAASATKYTVPEFWSMVERVGFTPGHVTIEPRNELDSCYAYMSFTKPEA